MGSDDRGRKKRKCGSVCYSIPGRNVVGATRSYRAVAMDVWTMCAIDATGRYKRTTTTTTPGSLRWMTVGVAVLLLLATISSVVQCQTFIRPATDIGDYCLHNDQCQYTLSTGNSECRDNSCQCVDGAHYVEREKRCYKTSFLGEYCRLTNNCIGNDTYCRDGICVCTPGKHPNTDRNRCLHDAKLGDQCYRDEECVTDNSRCAQEICTCRVSHVLNEMRNRCLPIASKIYDLCEENIQCLYNIPHSQCRITTGTDGITAGRCTCASRFHEAGFKCVSSVHLNGICEVNDNCIDRDTSCYHGRCRCIDHMIEVDGICSGTSALQRSSIVLGGVTLAVLGKWYYIS
ncbi:prion-like-(Q/N-rich) domain-bearing protein 25 isoform X2 [Anopheles funestus]|uniref:prion-like-(Q/N-rich) domain-bearing protein 25 isoform X2 n=1 Tax=Anopheles funestus TaxID=62324 RepID=UPI0020C723FB|nr:prion-like-(Q/N-rich) domain-bearing protein 25 isoform X2 [Anopheles funestus]